MCPTFERIGGLSSHSLKCVSRNVCLSVVAAGEIFGDLAFFEDHSARLWPFCGLFADEERSGRDGSVGAVSTNRHRHAGLARSNRTATADVNAAASQIRASAQQQAASVEEQFAAVQETAATVDEITHSGAQIGKRASEVIATAQAIGEIITTVDDNSERTHLLALNAAIEELAARAEESVHTSRQIVASTN